MDNNEKDLPFGIMTGIIQLEGEPKIGLMTVGGPLMTMSLDTASHLIDCLCAHLYVLGYDPEDEDVSGAPDATPRVLH